MRSEAAQAQKPSLGQHRPSWPRMSNKHWSTQYPIAGEYRKLVHYNACRKRPTLEQQLQAEGTEPIRPENAPMWYNKNISNKGV